MMENETPALELKLEKLLTRAWRVIISVEKYLISKPKNRFEVIDKHALILEIGSFILLLTAIVIRLRG